MKNNGKTRKEIKNINQEGYLEYYDKGKLPYKIKVSTLKNDIINEASVQVIEDLETAGTSFMKRTATVISNAEILTLNSSPVELVPAPGAGKFILLHTIWLKTNFNSTDEVTNSGQAVNVFPEGEADRIFSLTANTSENTYEQAVQEFGSSTSDLENKAIVIQAEDGDYVEYDGTFEVFTTYEIITLP